MFLFVIGAILALVGLFFVFAPKKIFMDTVDVGYGKTKTEDYSPHARVIGAIALVIAAILIFISAITTVPTGYTGILITFGRVEDTTFEAGFHLKAPWQSMIKMNNQEQRVSFKLQAFSSDIQQVDVSGSINYNIDKATAMTLYREVGTSYAETLITPRLYENTKAVFSKYPAEDLIIHRNNLSDEIEKMMSDDLKNYGINVMSISVEDIDFTDAFTNAVEAKQVASQNKLKAETEQEQMTMEAKAAAERDKVKANAEAEVRKIKADAEAYEIKVKAEAEADANTKIAESLSDELIQYNYANNWNGTLPTTVVGESDIVPVMNIGGNE